MSLKLVLLDRDGVLNEVIRGNYVKGVDEFRWIPRSVDAVVRLQRAGFQVAVVTNQQGVARGLMTAQDLDQIHGRLADELVEAGGEPLQIYACMHLESDDCDCRKPKPGLIRQALSQADCPPTEAILVGDSVRDMRAAQAAGVKFILVRTGVGVETEASLSGDGIRVENDLFEVSLKLAGGHE